jgi:hypothetical protein
MAFFQRTKLDNAAGTTINPATSDLQTSGAQKTQIVDGSGNVISSQANHLSVAAKLIDEAGVAYGVKHVNNKPRVSAMPYTYDIAEGNVPDHVAWSKIGFTPTMNTTESDVWSAAGVYTFQTTAAAREVVSSNNADIGVSIKTGNSTGGSTTTLIDAGANFTAATAVAIGDLVILDKSGAVPEYGWVTAVTSATELAIAGGFSSGGTGSGRAYAIVDTSANAAGHAVRIGYLTTAFAEKYEIVILNGTGAVATVNNDIYRINSFRLIAAGSNFKPTGNLTLRVAAAGATMSFITAGFTRARNIIYTVPANKILYVTSFTGSFATTGNANKEYARLYTRATQESGFRTQNVFQAYTEISLQNSVYQIMFVEPTPLKSGVDIKVSGVSTAAGIASVALRGWLEVA